MPTPAHALTTTGHLPARRPWRSRAVMAVALLAALAVSPAATVPAAAAETFTISGRVHFAGTSIPSPVYIAARHQENGWNYTHTPTVRSDGTYTISGLVAGTYVLQLWGQGTYYSQLEGGHSTNAIGSVVGEVGIALTGDITDHDVTMFEGGRVRGTVNPGLQNAYTEVRAGDSGAEVSSRSQWAFDIVVPAGVAHPVEIWRRTPGSYAMTRWVGTTATVAPGEVVDVGVIDASLKRGAYTVVTPPSITGDAVVGQTLTAHLGSWRVADTDSGTSNVAAWFLAPQWLRDGAPIDGATGTTRVLTAADAGARISVQVRSNAYSYMESPVAVSAASDVVAKKTTTLAAPTIVGDATPGGVLTAAAPVVPDGALVEAVWYRGTQEIGRGPQYTVTLAEAGHDVRVGITATHPDYDDATAMSAAVAIGLAASSVDLTVDAVERLHGVPSLVTATVSVPHGTDAGMVVLREGQQELTAAPVVDGTAVLVVPPTLSPGSHDLVAVFTPSHPGVTGATSATTRLEFTSPQIQVALTPSSAPDTVAELNVAVRHLDAPLGGTVRAFRAGVPVGAFTLDRGRAVVPIPRGLPAGDHHYTVEYEGPGGVVGGPGLTFRVGGVATGAGPTVAEARDVVPADGVQRVVLTGLAPHEQVVVYMFSAPSLLGTFTADMLGALVIEFAVPAGTAAGAHTLELRTAGRVLSHPFTVAPAPVAPAPAAPGVPAAPTAPATAAQAVGAGAAPPPAGRALAATGVDVAATLATASLLLIVGAAAMLAARPGGPRRRCRQQR